jgi:hypothetical protein
MDTMIDYSSILTIDYKSNRAGFDATLKDLKERTQNATTAIKEIIQEDKKAVDQLMEERKANKPKDDEGLFG